MLDLLYDYWFELFLFGIFLAVHLTTINNSTPEPFWAIVLTPMLFFCLGHYTGTQDDNQKTTE